MMNGVLKNDSSALRYLNVVSVSILQSAVNLYTQVRELHPAFKLIHGQVVDDVAPAGKSQLYVVYTLNVCVCVGGGGGCLQVML